MKIVKRNEGQMDQAPGHFGQWGVEKIALGKDSKRIGFLISHFLPGGGVEPKEVPVELIYYQLKGSLQITIGNEKHILEAGDTIYIPAGEKRGFIALGDEPSTILIIVGKVD